MARKRPPRASEFSADPWWGAVMEGEQGEAVAAEPIARTRHERRVREDAKRRSASLRRDLLWRRIRFAIIVLSVLLLGWLGYVVPRMSVFQIRTVSVEGASAVPDLLVRNQVDSQLQGQTLFTVDSDAITRRLEALPFVRTAQVDRHLPDGLAIRITEYEPLAFGVAGDGGWLVARDGRVLTRARLDDWRARVPVVRLREEELRPGQRLAAEPTLLVLSAVPPTFPGSIRAIERTNEFGYVAELHDGPSIRLGRAQDLERKLTVAGKMLAIFSHGGQSELDYIDVTVASRPAVLSGKSAG